MTVVRYVGNAGQYRLTQSGVDIEAGDTADVDDEVAERLLARDDFELADEPDEAVHEEDGPPDTRPPIGPSSYTVSELEAAVDDGDYSDGELRAIRAAEASGKNRKGVRGAIDARLED